VNLILSIITGHTEALCTHRVLYTPTDNIPGVFRQKILPAICLSCGSFKAAQDAYVCT